MSVLKQTNLFGEVVTPKETRKGRKLKFNEPTTTISIRVPESSKEHLKSMINIYLDNQRAVKTNSTVF